MAGRHFYQDSDHGFWCSLSPQYTVDLCERFWQEFGHGVGDETRWAVIREFIMQAGIRSALILDPLGWVRALPRWKPEYRRHVREILSVYLGCASADFNGGVLVDGSELLETLQFQCHHWMRAGGNNAIIFPDSNAHLYFCELAGVHLFAEREGVVEVFRAACDTVIGKCVTVIPCKNWE